MQVFIPGDSEEIGLNSNGKDAQKRYHQVAKKFSEIID